MKDLEYMNIAIDMALKGRGWTNPNPMVGAVIVKDDEIISTGYHRKYGDLHAERMAIKNCKKSLQGASLYVTLEPCCHYGLTPPCTEIIVESGIKRVVIGTLDPNPKVASKGVQILRDNGIEVVVGILEKECKDLIKIFSHYIKTKKPYITMKYAMTMDGKIATFTGSSQWITGEIARSEVHKSRHYYSSIMVGVNTVIEDDPMLTSRLDNTKNPIRIICDTNLRTPLASKIVQSSKEVQTIIATCELNSTKHSPYIDMGCEIITVDKYNSHLNILKLVEIIGSLNIDSILLEGGSTLNWSALKSGIVNSVQAYIAPKLFGGVDAKSPIGGLGVEFPNDAIHLTKPTVRFLGDDILLESEVINRCSQEL
ncbi:diaminohydroxyphosphoribosylaminopyrimidine deaminase / 5-amino-6-(5-phosphoribosylamino)uracil reductase [Anaerosphaera aminiphila DSM 21120]|uniref:Riboflavin biosynthesis protein RibD n=1 Tax=Anaerosphaera aminiphila DSM 21120 TaxID=1120995 RepID=A0A1M5U6I0_9FIRM|nr:bifunctional diaminohydroxyphosphoribosylaminopyrimidine deaminase/5-amino-6-(5-phosphoribosylamino)uracil reductase RibD [Anaerosphaera aminiphila]SHH58549.1 diaminohydroxyphosphoribosylaminopyrimidine deaminase / 5-amino-6-(5-phosphoribosylamino)uracil reductase [Anaerosphaera aminiphila DSM 21120]